MQKSRVSKIKTLFGSDDLKKYFEEIVMCLIQLHVPDLSIIRNNQFNSQKQEDPFFRNVANENYHTNVVKEMKNAIVASDSFYRQFKNFVLNTIVSNSTKLIDLQNKNQYNDRKTIYDILINQLKKELYKGDIKSEFFTSMKELIIKCNNFFSERRYPNYILPLLCQELINGRLESSLPYSQYQQYKKKYRNNDRNN